MNDSLKKRGDALEEDFFRKKNEEALARLQTRNESEEKPRLSPITGEPMVQKTYKGVIIDVCPTSKGIFLDHGELEMILESANQDEDNKPTVLSEFVDFFMAPLKPID